jgi:hypothetical protein
MAFRIIVSGVLVAALGVAGCVTDPEVEDDVIPPTGATQPAGGGVTVTAEAACQALAEAETTARDRLGCEERTISCPGHVYLAGATPCAEYDEASVEACTDAMAGYRACSDFGTRPCIVTLVADSCTPPALPDAGPGDAEAGAPDAGPEGGDGGGGPDGGDGGAPEGGDASLPDGGDAGGPLDAGDAGGDGAVDGRATDGATDGG